jgi:hypothetical protein
MAAVARLAAAEVVESRRRSPVSIGAENARLDRDEWRDRNEWKGRFERKGRDE